MGGSTEGRGTGGRHGRGCQRTRVGRGDQSAKDEAVDQGHLRGVDASEDERVKKEPGKQRALHSRQCQAKEYLDARARGRVRTR